MTTTITPVAQYTASNPSVTSGAEGGLAFDTGPGPMNAVLQMAFDRALYARGATWGTLEWTGDFAVYSASSNTTFAIRVGVIQSVTLRDGNGVWRPYFTSATTTLGLADVEGSPANLSNSTWYYVYAWSDSAAPSSIKFQISTSPPTENAAPTILTGYKRGETANYRYLGSFVTDSTGTPIPGVLAAGRWTYRASACAGTDVVLSHGRATTWSAVDLSALVPPHARVVRLRCSVARAAADIAAGLELRTPGDATAIEVCLAPNVSTSDTRADATFELVVPAQSIEYQLNTTVTSGAPYGATIAVLGWE